LFREKGVYEFIDIAREVTACETDVKFQLIGAPDPGVSTAVSQEEIDGWLEEGIIAYSGLSEDMSASLAEVDVLILPTRHPEGTPRILIEAAASGVVAVAADIEGCRSVIEDGTTGLLVSPDENMVREMATRVMLLHSDRRMLEHLSVAATSYSSRRFSLKDTLAKVFAMLSIPKRRQDGYA
jgi:glycosyltransferase involved in cell wall biosynthesis